MKKQDRHRYSLSDKLHVIELYEQGYGSTLISAQLGFTPSKVSEWLSRYRILGIESLAARKWGKYSCEFKESVVRDILDNYLSYDQASYKHGVSSGAAYKWVGMVRSHGYEALREQKPRGRPPKPMGRPKKKPPQSEVEKPQAELEYLRAENAYLKKLRALVEERVRRESGRLPRPSKD